MDQRLIDAYEAFADILRAADNHQPYTREELYAPKNGFNSALNGLRAYVEEHATDAQFRNLS